MGFNFAQAFNTAASFGNGYMNGQQQQQAQQLQLGTLAEQIRRAKAQQDFEAKKLQQEAEDKELDRQQSSASDLQRAIQAQADRVARAGESDADRASREKLAGNTAALSAGNAVLDAAKTFRNQPGGADIFNGFAGGLRQFLPPGTKLPGDMVEPGGFNVNRINPDGTETPLDTAQPSFVPQIAPDPNDLANLANTQARTVQTQTQTGLLKPEFNLKKDIERRQEVTDNKRLGLQAQAQADTNTRFKIGQANADARQDKTIAHVDTVAAKKAKADASAKIDADLNKQIADAETEVRNMTGYRDGAYAYAKKYSTDDAIVKKKGDEGHAYWQGQIDTASKKLQSLRAQKQQRHPTNGQFVPQKSGGRTIKTRSGNELSIE